MNINGPFMNINDAGTVGSLSQFLTMSTYLAEHWSMTTARKRLTQFKNVCISCVVQYTC